MINGVGNSKLLVTRRDRSRQGVELRTGSRHMDDNGYSETTTTDYRHVQATLAAAGQRFC